MEFIIKHRGKQIELDEIGNVNEEWSVGEFRQAIATKIGSEPGQTKLLSHGKMISPQDDSNALVNVFSHTSKRPINIIVMASSSATIKAVAVGEKKILNSNHRLHDDISPSPLSSRALYIGKPRKTRQIQSSSEYGFGLIESLHEYSDHHKAQNILDRLASDKGIQQVMRLKKWKVGALREMKPEGTVGEEICVLGYNVGMGQEIRLRIRTDDEAGFRPIAQLLHVLAHELAHNVESNHGVAFKETMRWIERTLAHKDWRGLGGRSLADGSNVRAISSQAIANENGVNSGVNSNGGRLGGTTSSMQNRPSNLEHSRLVTQDDQQQRRNDNDNVDDDNTSGSKNSDGHN